MFIDKMHTICTQLIAYKVKSVILKCIKYLLVRYHFYISSILSINFLTCKIEIF